ncbi:VOC family protein [Glycomyces sp. L485]|uniref:VOC family protein n=1 Tax=Glycomyces sp. L485 TaxID=2909235 RepID=UPI001F4BA2F0|nr:VOC family protein [Glycomyces sp. L485]MCH7230051.1 VOC family protein [Glycomyces sp. L485]
MQKIVTNIWYDTEAEEAARFYCSLFEDSKILRTQPYSEAGPGEPGSTMVVEFELFGQRFTGINGGGEFQHSHAMSLLVNCDDQAEVDRLWEAILDKGGSEIQCGWVADKWGVNWQIWPAEADQMLKGPAEAALRATKAMYAMKKIDLQAMRDAYDGK